MSKNNSNLRGTVTSVPLKAAPQNYRDPTSKLPPSHKNI